MAAKTTLNAKNLEALGAERLAALVMEVAEGDAARKRIARAALLEAAGGSALAGAVSKRLVSLRRAKSWVNYKKRRAFIDDLDRQRALIATQIAADAPKEALDLIWRFMALADTVHHRIDDSSGAVGDIFWQACRDLGTIVAKAKPKPEALADQIFQALTEANGFGEFDELISVTAPTLGEHGLGHLRARLEEAREIEAENAAKPDRDRGRVVGFGSGTRLYEADLRYDHITSAVHLGLLAIADALGDVDAYLAEHSPKQRTNPISATRIAERLVTAERAGEALAILDGAAPLSDFGYEEWTEARLAVLEALGRLEDAQSLRWRTFERDLDAGMLREYLARLPDFDDVEAEERALDLVTTRASIHGALGFLIGWPAHHRAAALIREKHGSLDGALYLILGPASEALETTYPLAATLLLRAMVEDTLRYARSTRYKHAVRHLQTCGFLSGVIEAWDEIEPHDAFVARLRKDHARKAQFWYLTADEI